MGNQPSAPPSTQTPTQAPPPQLPPVCDADCQRQKLLSGLKTTLDEKTATKSTDPEGYEQARIAYYTALKGQGWLADEKNRIAKAEIEPVISTYTNQYNTLKSQTSNNKVFTNLMSVLESDQKENEEETRFLHKQFQSDADEASVLNRLKVLQQQATTSSSMMPTLMDALLVIVSLAVVYLLYSKFTTLKSYFGYDTPVVPIGGKRLP